MKEKENISAQQKNNRKVIVAICGIPVIVILLSSLLYYLVNSKGVDLGTVNNGELITPPLLLPSDLSSLPTETVDGDQEPKWAYMIIGDKHCIDACERMLYVARQSIVALARKMGRVKLVYTNTDSEISEALSQRLDKEYKGIEIHNSSSDLVDDLFSGTAVDPFDAMQFFVVDPRGWLMMRYTVEDTSQETLNVLGKAVVRDMRRLIK